ncbi:uncharacterized protein VTP21DRAFT_1552 [Calcarisporiella thermophila]|uniref:uncharacterized protein n=1 Tax=Calcarisporiella thermophila TaxID=911321 RepID=UPI0037446690
MSKRKLSTDSLATPQNHSRSTSPCPHATVDPPLSATTFLNDEDDFLTEEQRRIVNERVAKLQAQFKKRRERLENEKLEMLMVASLSREEAHLALEIHGGDEQAVLDQLADPVKSRALRRKLEKAINSATLVAESEEAVKEGTRKKGRQRREAILDEQLLAKNFEKTNVDIGTKIVQEENTTLLPLKLDSTPTTILSLGRYHPHPDYWSSQTALYHHIYPPGFLALRIEWDREFLMSIEEGPEGKPLFLVEEKATGKRYQGNTPTQPWTEVCLAYRSTKNTRISGPLYYGFSDPKLQQLLAELALAADPDEYLYRLLPPDQTESFNSSEFTPEEQALLLRQLSAFASNSDKPQSDTDKNFDESRVPWGLLSKQFPGRAGFQLHHAYNTLVSSGNLASPLPCVLVTELRASYRHLVKANTYCGKSKRLKNKREIELAATNPVPDITDMITHQPMREPAISPDGYVCDYNNWVKILNAPKSRNLCPFTRKPLTRRQLVKLTWENVDMYRDLMMKRIV